MNWIQRTISLAALTLTVVSCSYTSATTAEAPPVVKETYSYKTIAGHEILADVYSLPAGDEPQPVVMWIHGGGLIFGAREWMPEEQLKRYMAAGYVVVAVDHRLIPETQVPEVFADIQDAYAWIRASGPTLFNADPEKIAVVGHSSGGYLALASGYILSPRPTAIVSLYGFGDLTGDWTVLPNPYFLRQPAVTESEALATVGQPNISNGGVQYDYNARPKFFRYTKQQGSWTNYATGRDPRAEPEWFETYEPAKNVHADYPPTLLIHGQKDTDVPFEQSVMFAETLASNGVEHRLIIDPEWEHLFDLNTPDLPSVQRTFDEMAAFLLEKLR